MYLYKYKLALIIHRFLIWEFIYLLKFIFNAKNQTAQYFCGHLWHVHAQNSKKFGWYTTHIPSWRSKRAMLLGLAHAVNKGAFHGPFKTMLFLFLCFFLVILFRMAPKCSAEVLVGVPKRKKAVRCLMEKVDVFD